MACASDDRKLFIDLSKPSLKPMLLFNIKTHPSIPVEHSDTTKKTYETMKLSFNSLQYPQFFKKIYGNLKIISLFLGEVWILQK